MSSASANSRSEKRRRLLELAHQRKAVCWEGYRPIADYHDGLYDCDWVSPYSKSACNVDARVFILLQDWSSDEFLSRDFSQEIAELGHDPTLPSNKNLKRLLRAAFNLALEDVFGTNLFPFIKTGAIGKDIPAEDMDRAAREFAMPQVAIVEPALVICLGLATFRAVQRAQGLRPSATIADALGESLTIGTTQVRCQSHPGGRGMARRGGYEVVLRDWLKMKAELEPCHGLR